MHDLRTRGLLESSWTKLRSGGNGPIESACFKIEQTLLALQIPTCISTEKLSISCQFEENYVNLLYIKYILVSVSQSSSEFSVSNFTSLSINLCIITQEILINSFIIHQTPNMWKSEWLYRKTYVKVKENSVFSTYFV